MLSESIFFGTLVVSPPKLVHCNGRSGSTEFEDAGIKPAATSPLQWARSRGLYARAVRYRIYRCTSTLLPSSGPSGHLLPGGERHPLSFRIIGTALVYDRRLRSSPGDRRRS